MHAGFASWQITINRDDITFLIAIVGAATGIVGTGLGVINLWLTWKRGRLSLKVIPKSFFGICADGTPDPACFHTNSKGGKSPRYLCIEVRKHKGIPVWVNEVGFLIKGSSERAVITEQFAPYRIDIPFRLEAHSSKTVYADALRPEAFEIVSKYRCAYADVASGKRFTGKSGMLKHLRKFAEGRQADLDRNDSAS
jgi:hypothetical protein